MKRHMFVVLGAIVWSVLGSLATADPSVVFSPPTDDYGSASGTLTATEIQPGVWEVTVDCHFLAVQGPLSITLRAGEPDQMAFVKLTGYASTGVRLSILGPGSGRCGPIGTIDGSLLGLPSGAEAALAQVHMKGDLGSPSAPEEYVIWGFEQASNIDVLGDVYGHIRTWALDNHQNTICYIRGDMHGDLIAEDGYHRDIRILTRDDNGSTVGGNLYGNIYAITGRIE